MSRGRAHITDHAIERYRERVADIPEPEILAALDTPAVQAAAELGGECYVRLPSGQRIVVKDHTVVTVTPRQPRRRCKTGRPTP